jgi:hypothetical protein
LNRQVSLVLAGFVLAAFAACARGEIPGPTGPGVAGASAAGSAATGVAGQSTAGATGTTGAAGAAGTPPDDAPDAAPSPDADLPPDASCLQVRNCVAACPDEACVQRCETRASPAARALHDQLRACSLGACPAPQDETCGCQAECIFPGACADIQDMCAEAMTDPACTKCL